MPPMIGLERGRYKGVILRNKQDIATGRLPCRGAISVGYHVKTIVMLLTTHLRRKTVSGSVSSQGLRPWDIGKGESCA